MKTAEQILREHISNEHLDDTSADGGEWMIKGIVEAMEVYAEQWKYDFSKECKCNDSTGSTWCCNICGLPITPERDKDKKILEWMDLNLSAQSKLGASDEVIRQLLNVRSFFENYPK